jgi:biotin carboxylase
LVVKPTDSAGSRGIRLVRDRPALPWAIDDALRISPTCTAILEECVHGSHHTLEGFVTDGRLAFAALTTRTITDPPYLVTTSHSMPHGLPEPVCRRILDAVQTVCALLRFGTGPVDVDVVVELDGTVHLIEIGARVGGSGLTELIRLAYGADLVEASINAALGLPVDLEPRHEPRHGRLVILGSDRDGVVTAIRGEARVRAMPELAALRLVTAPGREVRAYRYAAAKLGYAILVADDVPALDAARATFADRLGLDIDHAREGLE